MKIEQAVNYTIATMVGALATEVIKDGTHQSRQERQDVEFSQAVGEIRIFRDELERQESKFDQHYPGTKNPFGELWNSYENLVPNAQYLQRR